MEGHYVKEQMKSNQRENPSQHSVDFAACQVRFVELESAGTVEKEGRRYSMMCLREVE